MTNRLQSRVFLSASNATCRPCLKPPPASRIGRLRVSCELALPRLLPKSTIVLSRSGVPALVLGLELAEQVAHDASFRASSISRNCSILAGSLPWCDRLW